jgi:predicted CXXCH cytochrome family protein
MKIRNLLYVLTMVIVAALTGCSATGSYRVLSFFFDGVPPKNTTVKETSSTIKDTTVAAANANESAKKPTTIHPPYAENQCNVCHNNGKFAMDQPALCYQCHADFATKYTFVHGPVAGGYCTDCHDPHNGNAKLLTRSGQDLCLLCHVKEDILKNEAHGDIGTTACTDCHNPHGGQDHYLFN